MARAKPKRANRTPKHDALVQQLVDDHWSLFLPDPLQGENLTDAEKKRIIREAEHILQDRNLAERAEQLRERLTEWPPEMHEQVARELQPIEDFLSKQKRGKTK